MEIMYVFTSYFLNDGPDDIDGATETKQISNGVTVKRSIKVNYLNSVTITY